MNATPIAIMSGILNDDTAKPSTKFLVNKGTTRPASVVITLAIKPTVNATFGIFVDKIKSINGFRPSCFFFISISSFNGDSHPLFYHSIVLGDCPPHSRLMMCFSVTLKYNEKHWISGFCRQHVGFSDS